MVLLHNGRFYNSCITKIVFVYCNSTNVSYNYLVSRLLECKDESKKNLMLFSFLNNIGFLMKCKLAICKYYIRDASVNYTPLCLAYWKIVIWLSVRFRQNIGTFTVHLVLVRFWNSHGWSKHFFYLDTDSQPKRIKGLALIFDFFPIIQFLVTLSTSPV